MIRIPSLRKLWAFRTDAMPELRNPALRDYIYSGFFTQNATSKQTSVGRFGDLDRLARSIIMEHRLDVIHDVGVSSGVTSLELFTRSPRPGSP